MTSRTIGYRLYVAASIFLAIGAFVAVRIIGQREGFYFAGVDSLWLGGAWIAVIAVGVLIYGKRGLWMLASAPIALLVPIYFLIFWDGGSGGTGCL
jgi:hypothetical protein